MIRTSGRDASNVNAARQQQKSASVAIKVNDARHPQVERGSTPVGLLVQPHLLKRLKHFTALCLKAVTATS
jgi:hypothetical protein